MSKNIRLFTAKMFDGREFELHRQAIHHPDLFQYTMVFGPHRYEITDAEDELFAWLHRVFNQPFCPHCALTGQRDHGGSYPWGQPITMPCECGSSEEKNNG